ncbi:hypothetical protein H1C71_030731 [Ictidomys tridecemlineatus]|uniref:EGF-like domain-containing protein n=1 Tax=Ictidomys tridecemlineatus TaxID=43179 RepID=A0A287CUS7_ICTTR|nr:hypothetical protein H1C71_030731 [Ictidomys tridecemlineatus]
MVDCIFIFTRILFISCCFLTIHCAQPNCTSVTDFDDCPGNITDFCPENIVCACKDGEPFCKCPNFRGRWGNYWFMGAKCDQLWNTLDLILVATLPGIGLALIVGVTIQTIHYCKKKSKKNLDNNREQKSLSGLRPQHNSAYAFETNLRPPQPDQDQVNTETHLTNENPWSLSHQGVLPGSPVSPSSQFSGRNYNFKIHEPKEDNHYNYPSHNWDDSQGPAKPEAVYGNKYSSNMHMKPLFDFSTPGVPKSSYIQKERQHIGYSSSEEPGIPYRIGRVQMKPNY